MKNSSAKRKIQKTNRFSKDIRKIALNIQKEAYQIAMKLSYNIFDPSLNVKKLVGFEKVYRVAIVKDYRLIFTFNKDNIFLLRIGHRKDIYKNIEI